MPIIKIKNLLCSPLTALLNHYLMMHRHWRINILRNQRANNHFFIVLHRFGTNIFIFMLVNWKSIAMKLIYLLLWRQFNILRKFMRQMNFPDFEGKDDDSYLLLQNPTKTPIILKDFLRALSRCLIIHWASQMFNDARLYFCACSKHSKPWRENNNIFIHYDHECKVGLMIPQELLTYLKNKGDYTHTAIYIYI